MFRVWAVGRCLPRSLHMGALHMGALHQGALHQGALHQGALHQGALHQGALHQGALHQGGLHGGTVNRDMVLEQLSVCTGEEQLLEVVGRNKAKLTVDHVGSAISMLWRFQKKRPEILRTVELVKNDPQFLSLRVLAENKIALMDDSVLVDMLYNVLRLNVERHDSLVQQLVSEAWLRLDRFSLPSLSKFATCLGDQHLYQSPLMGQITEIVNQKLSSIDNSRVLTTLMISISSLASSRLRDALVHRADLLLDDVSPHNYNCPRRVVQFLRNSKHTHRPLLEKCNRIFLNNIHHMDAENIGIILGHFQGLQFQNSDFRLAARQRLLELVDSSTDPASFTKLFVALGPMAGEETRERLESTALLLAEEFNAQQALAVIDTLEDIQCRNLSLIHKIASILNNNLHLYKTVEVARICQSLIYLHYQSPHMFAKLRNIVVKCLQDTVYPYEVTMLSRVLSMLPYPGPDDAVLSKVEAVLPQCNLNDLNTIALAIAKWVQNDPSYRHSTPGKYVRQLQTLNRCGHSRLQTVQRLDLLLDELRYISGEWFDEMLLEETMVTLRRMEDQISWNNLPELAIFLTKTGHLCPPLLDRIAQVIIKDISKIHYSATYPSLLPFAVLNYDPPGVDEMFEAAIEHIKPHISSFNPHLLVLLAYALAVADCIPEELVREIFSVDFLSKLDAQLEILPDALNMRIRLRLMELNRAVCIECPQAQVPWFHERYCQLLQRKASSSPVQQQIHRMLGDVLGGMNCAKVAAVVPYFYTVGFECILDRHHRPIPYCDNQLQISDGEKVRWESDSLGQDKRELPPGAQRVAVDFLDYKSFCKNSRHMKGEAVMRKRHLEILGYHVVQIPHFEWNSMELSTQESWKKYLKKKIFTDLP